MRSRRRSSHSDDEDDGPDEEEDEEDEDDEEEPPRRRRRPPRRLPGAHRGPPRRWRGPEDSEEEEEEPAAWAGPGRRHRPPIFWRARDSLYFEPLVALAIIVVLLVSLYAYTGNWPPVYVVESGSMQHGSSDVLGLINAGDLVLAKQLPSSSITPYLVGLVTGYSTYGEYGDVLLYHPNGDVGGTPIIHRALLYFDWNAATSSYSAPELGGLPCGAARGAVYAPCGTTGIRDGSTISFYGIGWRATNVTVTVAPSTFGDHSGFLTMGDNNSEPDQMAGFSTLVEPGWIIGVARGMIPWFGGLKLLLEGNGGRVPAQSWEFMGLTVAGLILLAFGIHYALRVEGIETPLRKEEEEEARAERAAEEDEEEREGRPRGWLRSLRSWHRDHEEEDEDEELRPSRRRFPLPRPRSQEAGRRGRPRPRVRRGEKSDRRSRDHEL